jgi:hypothetical protein
MSDEPALIPYEAIEQRILVLRGQKVMLDRDLAALYGVSTKAFNQAIKRNGGRFPTDFIFQLSPEEAEAVRSQNVTASRRNVRYLPFAFTEHGAIMAATILNSPRAIEASVWVVRAFVKYRDALATHKLLVRKLSELDTRVGAHDAELRVIIKALKQLMAEPAKKKKAIGFGAKEAKGKYRSRHA